VAEAAAVAVAVGFAGRRGQRMGKVLGLEDQSLATWLVGLLEMKDEILLWAGRVGSDG
jgi:hypothetical protein